MEVGGDTVTFISSESEKPIPAMDSRVFALELYWQT